MMAEQKGRGGKKPKYQIADIGGSDLTAQDLSTERVLNFLIKGETGPAEEGVEAPRDETPPVISSPDDLRASPAEQTPAPPLPSPALPGKKSLAHLFVRASGVGGAAREHKADSGSGAKTKLAPSVNEITGTEAAPAEPAEVRAEGLAEQTSLDVWPVAVGDTPPPVISPEISTQETEAVPQVVDSHQTRTEHPTPPATDSENAELTQLVSLWKNFYRLNDGEVETLRAMFQMSHGQGSPECYIKMRNLAEMSNLTYRYCQKVVRGLEQLGWITKLQDYDSSTHLGVLYRVNLKPLA